ncbi:hypothetical protein BDF14DRAFT_1876267 [Spinellus fusiger]|nr:hypothetical protein BDF14DRAFT_1876267 [Spinellus fusiger]
MVYYFIYEDGHGKVVGEKGGSEPMDSIVDQNKFIVETIAANSEYLKTVASSEFSLTCPILIEKPKDEDVSMKEANTKWDYVRYIVQDKTIFFDLKTEKCMSESVAAKQLGIHVWTVQRWVKQCNMCPDSIFEDCKKVGRRCILTEEHKMTVINFIDANPSATIAEVTEHLLKRLNDLKVSPNTVNNFMTSKCNLLLEKKLIFILSKETV